ncbi:MAG: family 10 glycosylhydrolase [Candidatus Omnitrophica bacterium]|nr:family 10 glycosylhydrolase [Candidatus Omnitrophota bacterium]
MSEKISRRDFLGTTVSVAAGLVSGAGTGLLSASIPTESRLIDRIDCTRDLGPDRYFAYGTTQVVEAGAGRYREAEGKPASRFGYRFRINKIGQPHVAVIRFPDDKRRYMCIMDGTTYDLTTGVFTDWAQPLSGKMLEMRQVFWPRWEDCSITFMTWGEGEPAAAASIEIHELGSLPALELPGDPGDDGHRELGIQYEDPCGTGVSEGASNRDEWMDRVVQYARYTGQGLLVYPMAWYHGPQFPCECEPADGFDMVVAGDRKQYSRWTTHPADWYAKLLERFDNEGLSFQGALTLMRLGTLLERMNIDLESIRSGKETFNNMMWNNQVQSSTNDWTPIYNARNFNVIAENLKKMGPSDPGSALPQNVYGERHAPGSHTAPMFNPLHPVVREAILRFVEEIGERYGRYPAFKGISFNMFASAMPWFGSIHAGYDDYSIALFERETGIAVPVNPKAPDRFAQRYEYLTFVCRPAWVAWRCRKIRALFGDIHRALAGARPDLRVTVTLWDETMVTNTLGGPARPALQLHARRDMHELFRDAGIDLTLFDDEPGLEVDRGMGNSRDRGGHGSNPAGGVNLPVSETTMYRDFDFLDQQTIDAFHAHPRPGAFIFNCWVEAWGKHVWFQPEAGDPNLAKVKFMDGKPAEGILRLNSEYPKDGFWWDSQLRITPGFPAGIHFMEPYVEALADMDACRITRGGLFLDKAHSELIARFARAYRALPRQKFDTVGKTTDPVAVRSLRRAQAQYFYAVNREYYPVEVRLTFSHAPTGLRDLATGKPLVAPPEWVLILGPYELRSFAADTDVRLIGFSATPPPLVVERLTDEARRALASFDKVRQSGKFIPGMDDLESGMRAALAEGRFAWLRRVITGYCARKCVELSRSPES